MSFEILDFKFGIKFNSVINVINVMTKFQLTRFNSKEMSVSEKLKKDLASKYDIEPIRKDLKVMTIILLAVIIIFNQNFLEFLIRVLGLMK